MSESIQDIHIRDTETRLNPKAHIVYRVEVNAAVRTWSVWKRYSEFDELNDKLIKLFPSNPPPLELPAKHYFQSTLGNPVLIEERRRGLEEYLREIFFHKDDRWRETDEWKDFLAIPTGRTLDAASMYTSESWLDEYNEVQAKAKEIRSLLNKRDTHTSRNEVQLSHNFNMQARKNLTLLGVRVTQLDAGLKGLAEGNGKDRKAISEGELRRRNDMLSELKEEKDTLTKLALAKRTDISKAATPASSMDREALFSQPTKPSMNRGISFGNSNDNGVHSKAPSTPPSSRRVFGNSRVTMPAETEQTRGLDNEGLVGLQKQTMEEQDQHVEQFSAILSRHKHIGLAIGQELDYQNQLLGELDRDLDKTTDKLRITTRKMKSIK